MNPTSSLELQETQNTESKLRTKDSNDLMPISQMSQVQLSTSSIKKIIFPQVDTISVNGAREQKRQLKDWCSQSENRVNQIRRDEEKIKKQMSDNQKQLELRIRAKNQKKLDEQRREIYYSFLNQQMEQKSQEVKSMHVYNKQIPVLRKQNLIQKAKERYDKEKQISKEIDLMRAQRLSQFDLDSKQRVQNIKEFFDCLNEKKKQREELKENLQQKFKFEDYVDQIKQKKYIEGQISLVELEEMELFKKLQQSQLLQEDAKRELDQIIISPQERFFQELNKQIKLKTQGLISIKSSPRKLILSHSKKKEI